jgi:hypothetical protein
MLRYLLVLLLPFSLYASKILSYNIYDRTDRVDVMLTFDTPYTGRIKQSKTANKIIIKLQNASIESPKIKKLSSDFLKSITLTPMNNETQIIANVPTSHVKLIASKTADGYGLRLRFTTQQTNENKIEHQSISQNTNSSLPTKKGDEFSQSYYIVIFILVVGIAILFYIRKKMPTKDTAKKQATKTNTKNSPWLFQQNNTQEQTASTNSQEVSIRFQKALDANNSVVMLDFAKESYLVLMGNGNILLDKFHDNQPVSQQEFESVLQERHQELEAFLHGTTTTKPGVMETKEALQSYKERAASLVYGDES